MIFFQKYCTSTYTDQTGTQKNYNNTRLRKSNNTMTKKGWKMKNIIMRKNTYYNIIQ